MGLEMLLLELGTATAVPGADALLPRRCAWPVLACTLTSLGKLAPESLIGSQTRIICDDMHVQDANMPYM